MAFILIFVSKNSAMSQSFFWKPLQIPKEPHISLVWKQPIVSLTLLLCNFFPACNKPIRTWLLNAIVLLLSTSPLIEFPSSYFDKFLVSLNVHINTHLWNGEHAWSLMVFFIYALFGVWLLLPVGILYVSNWSHNLRTWDHVTYEHRICIRTHGLWKVL